MSIHPAERAYRPVRESGHMSYPSGGSPVYVPEEKPQECQTCFAVVVDEEAHNEWHALADRP